MWALRIELASYHLSGVQNLGQLLDCWEIFVSRLIHVILIEQVTAICRSFKGRRSGRAGKIIRIFADRPYLLGLPFCPEDGNSKCLRNSVAYHFNYMMSRIVGT